MAKNDFDVTLVSHLDDFNGELDEAIKNALYEVGEEAEGVCKKIITRRGLVKTGNLRNSITHAEGKYKGEPAVAIGTDVFYATYLECGTSKMEAKPYLKPTVEDKQFVDKYKEIFEEELGKIKGIKILYINTSLD